MSKFSLVLTLMLFSTWALAENFRDTIHSIDLGKKGEEHILKFENGRAIFIQEQDLALNKGVDGLIGQYVAVETDEKNSLIYMETLPKEESSKQDSALIKAQKTMTPTVIPNWNQALNIWRGMNRSYKANTECTDRAHVWAYEEWKKHNLYSKKSFLFFTNTYIRNYRFNWWFHVAPYALIREYGKDVEHIFDRKYASMPRHLKEWTDIFIRSRKTCDVTTYRHYRNNRNGPEHCFVVKSDMYYRLPLHVRNLEDRGVVKSQFSSGEVNFSYRAFNRRQ